MTPTDFQRLPSRELTPQPNSQGEQDAAIAEAKAKAEGSAETAAAPMVAIGFRNFTSEMEISRTLFKVFIH